MSIEGVGDQCYGCTACFSVCPHEAISMKESNEGFLYPHVNKASCVCCGKCSDVCPVVHQGVMCTDNRFFAGIHRDPDIWAGSTSGGAFCGICELFGDENTYIAGAVFNASTKTVEHKVIKGVTNAPELSGSKYVQSSIGSVFRTLRQLLLEGKSVIFCGTPCQVAGLVHCCRGIDSQKLLTISLVCNGVGSPKVFRDYLLHIERVQGSPIAEYQFRDKRIRIGIHQLYRATVVFENGVNVSKTHDAYNNCYVQKIVCRRSCFHCRFDLTKTEADITIGDFKRQYIVARDAPYDKNGSIIISHTAKGHAVCGRLEEVMTTYPVDDHAINYPSHGTLNEDKRDAFFEEYLKNDSDVAAILKKYTYKKRLTNKLCEYVPDKVKGAIKRLWVLDK